MSKIAVVYWSGTGNTEAMANEVAEGITEAGGEAASENIDPTYLEQAALEENVELNSDEEDIGEAVLTSAQGNENESRNCKAELGAEPGKKQRSIACDHQ